MSALRNTQTLNKPPSWCSVPSMRTHIQTPTSPRSPLQNSTHGNLHHSSDTQPHSLQANTVLSSGETCSQTCLATEPHGLDHHFLQVRPLAFLQLRIRGSYRAGPTAYTSTLLLQSWVKARECRHRQGRYLTLEGSTPGTSETRTIAPGQMQSSACYGG